MKKLFARFIALYLFASLVFSGCHAFVSNKWDFRLNRNGLLCIEISEHELIIYSPFCNHGDVFLFGLQYHDGKLYTFSDGFSNFGEYFDC